MREQLIAAVKAHAQGEIAKHRANVNVYLEHPAGIGEHSDITEAIQVELDKIARYHDQVQVIDHYFKSQMADIVIQGRNEEAFDAVLEAFSSVTDTDVIPMSNWSI